MSLRSTRKRRAKQRAQAEPLDKGTVFGGGCQFVAAGVREMAQEDLIGCIPESELAAIRAQDPHPLFLAIDIAQEGEATGHMVVNGTDVGSQRKLWGADAIKEFAAKLKTAAVKGAASFWHGDHGNKRTAGRILTSFVKQVGNAVHAIAVGWIHDDRAKEAFRAGEIEAGSMEAECIFDRRGESWLVRAVQAVQGIVLFGQGAKPGFAGATVLATVQELTKEDTTMPDEPLTLRDVQDLIRENSWTPSQVFGKEPLLDDRVVADALANEIKTKVAEAEAEAKKDLDALRADAEAHRKHRAASAVADLVGKSELLKDASKGEAAYLKKIVRVDLADVEKDKRQGKIDEAIKAQREIIKETGIKFSEPGDAANPGDEDGDVDGKGKGVPAGTGAVMHDGKDFTDPKVNPQIPG